MLTSEGQHITRGRESHTVNPTATVTLEFTAKSVERKLVAPNGRRRPIRKSCQNASLPHSQAQVVYILLINTLNEGRKHASLHVSRTGSKKDVVGMPVDREDSATNGLLDMLTTPPVIILVEITHRDSSGAASNSEFVFVGRPADVSSGTVDTQQHQSRLPNTIFLSPHVGVAILRAGHDTVGVGSKVNTSNNFVVLHNERREFNNR
jgi:hypothetical protein